MKDQEKIDKFIESKIDDDFGLSIDEVADKVTGIGRFSAWLGGDKSKIKQVLKAVNDEGVSHTFFAVYEYNEGYNPQFGWLNHTYPQGDYLTDARQVAKTVKKQSYTTGQDLAWGDYANSPWTPPQDVINEGEKDFRNLEKGTIGRAYIPLTAAATWAAYYPEGLKGSVNGVQDYANPFLDAANLILEWGGTLDNEGSSGSSGSNGSSSGFVGTIKDAINKALDKIEEMTQWDMYSIGSDRQFSNKYFYIMKTYNNTYKLKLNTSFIDEIQDIINNSSDASSGGSSGSDNEGKGKNGINTCSLKLDRNVMQWFHGTAEDASQNGYPFPTPHHGIDLRFNYEPVYAVMEGTVEDLIPGENPGTNGGIGYDGDGFGWGNRVSVKNEDGRGLMYAHLSEINVNPGDKVKVGDKIGVSGNTGEQTNTPHLHLELYDPKNSPYSDGRIDPLKFIKDHCSDYKNLDVKKDDTPID